MRTLGGDQYGIFAWAISIGYLVQLIAEFGFGSFAARYVIEKSEDLHGQLYVGILFIKSISF